MVHQTEPQPVAQTKPEFPVLDVVRMMVAMTTVMMVVVMKMMMMTVMMKVALMVTMTNKCCASFKNNIIFSFM